MFARHLRKNDYKMKFFEPYKNSKNLIIQILLKTNHRKFVMPTNK